MLGAVSRYPTEKRASTLTNIYAWLLHVVVGNRAYAGEGEPLPGPGRILSRILHPDFGELSF
jgi:hypothetical protein